MSRGKWKQISRIKQFRIDDDEKEEMEKRVETKGEADEKKEVKGDGFVDRENL